MSDTTEMTDVELAFDDGFELGEQEGYADGYADGLSDRAGSNGWVAASDAYGSLLRYFKDEQ